MTQKNSSKCLIRKTQTKQWNAIALNSANKNSITKRPPPFECKAGGGKRKKEKKKKKKKKKKAKKEEKKKKKKEEEKKMKKNNNPFAKKIFCP
ncbi:hypothetical protein M8J77_014291 [Diaphorina citri]|nr:hypothetical protein M8J77_014291 [Diaphorina citri]